MMTLQAIEQEFKRRSAIKSPSCRRELIGIASSPRLCLKMATIWPSC